MKAKKWLSENKSLNGDDTYSLRLFITGASPNSTRAVNNVKLFCEKYLQGKYQLEIIDVYQQPEAAQLEQIIALPLLIKKGPGMQRRMVGDMSDTKKLLTCFNIAP